MLSATSVSPIHICIPDTHLYPRCQPHLYPQWRTVSDFPWSANTNANFVFLILRRVPMTIFKLLVLDLKSAVVFFKLPVDASNKPMNFVLVSMLFNLPLEYDYCHCHLHCILIHVLYMIYPVPVQSCTVHVLCMIYPVPVPYLYLAPTQFAMGAAWVLVLVICNITGNHKRQNNLPNLLARHGR